ncbi:MAG TPA: hypothetical protein VMT81_03090 [Candidatus Paceibacterota bacterium]|nr:hypothetical protein [Candidatus Paceibacterota bacterium]
MIDVKKLITGFLVLATATSVSAMALSRFAGSFSPVAANAPTPVVSPGVGSNAFLTAYPFEETSGTPPYDDVNATDTDNLTANLANAMLSGILTTNPDGPQTDASGNPTMAAPSDLGVAAQLASSSAVAAVQIPDWDLEAAEQPVRIVPASSSDAAAYGSNLASIFDANFVNNGLQDSFSNNGVVADPSIVGLIASSSDQALSAAIAVPTPSPAVDFQKSFIKLLVYQKNFAELIEAAPEDPAKTYVIMQAEMPKYNLAVQQFKASFQSLTGQNLSLGNASRENSGAMAFLNTVFGVPTAHAQWAVFDPTNFGEAVLNYGVNYMNYAQNLLEWLQSLSLQIFKNAFVAALQTQITAWIQGGGHPRFVQSWSQTFSNAFLGAANATVRQITPNLSPSFSGLAGSLASPPSAGSASSSIKSNIDQEYASIGTTQQDFYTSFDNGGLTAYLDMFQPDNNVLGAAIDTQDAAMAAGSSQANATQQKATAANGFTSGGDQYCDDGSDPNGSSYYCDDDSTPSDGISGGGSCDDGTTAIQISNGGVCADGSEPIAETPAKSTEEGLSTAAGSGIQLVVNANNILDLALAVTNDLLSTLAKGTALTSVGPNSYTPSANASATINQYSTPPSMGTQPTPPTNITYPSSTGQNYSFP